MATLSCLMGFACLAPFRKKGGCQIHSAVTYMMAGLLVLNVYAEYFSLFAGVGFWASLIAVFAAVIGGMLLRRDLADFFKISKTQTCQKKTERSDEGLENSKSLWRKKNKAVWLLYAGLTLLFAYGSSRGYMHYDTGLYHACLLYTSQRLLFPSQILFQQERQCFPAPQLPERFLRCHF